MSNLKRIVEEHVFTFGVSQQHANMYHVITAESSHEARNIMIERFGTKWSMHYLPPNAKEDAGVDRFNLTELK